MGSGKSTIGPLLAEVLGFTFIDLDDEIEQREGNSIEDIFRISGEPNFRSLERSYLQRFIGGDETVFALGGGTVTIEGLIGELKTHGILVYLKTDADELMPRLQGHNHRPLLLGKEGETLGESELHRTIELLLQHREMYYSQADVIVETTNKPVNAVLESVLNALADKIDKDNRRII
jgi:shikimate kinase